MTTIDFTGDALRLWKRTLELAELTAGWDGAQALPMEKKALQNMQRLIKAGESTDFQQWVLFPDDNGTILMQSKDGKASTAIILIRLSAPRKASSTLARTSSFQLHQPLRPFVP